MEIEIEIEIEKGNKKGKNYWTSKETALLCNTFSEGKSIQIEFKEGYKLTNSIPHRVPIIVKPPAFMEDMTSVFDWIRST